jgi:hypothetical protein
VNPILAVLLVLFVIVAVIVSNNRVRPQLSGLGDVISQIPDLARNAR